MAQPTPTPSGQSLPPGPLSQIPLFAHLATEQQRALRDAMRPLSLGPHETVFWMGDEGDSFYLVLSGLVGVTVPNEAGEHVTLDTIKPGGFFGEISLLDGDRRTATLRTIEPTELLELSRAHFHEFLEQNPRAAIEILRVMGQRQRASTLAIRQIKNPNQAYQETLVPGSWHWAADGIARLAASRNFLLFHVVWFSFWVGYNLLSGLDVITVVEPFDPFPFGLLTMVVSLEAIFLSIFVMVSQNRQSERDRLRTDLDYQVNVKAQTEIMEITQTLERLEKALAAKG